MAISKLPALGVIIVLVVGCANGHGQGSPPNLPPSTGFEFVDCGWANEPAAVDCFESALQNGRAAQVFSRPVTTEGDTIYEIARLNPGRGVEIYSDFSEDRFIANGEEFKYRLCEPEGFAFVGDGYFSTGECEPAKFGW